MKSSKIVIILISILFIKCKNNVTKLSIEENNNKVLPLVTGRKLINGNELLQVNISKDSVVELDCLILRDSLVIKNEIRKIISSKDIWNHSLTDRFDKSNNKLVNTLFNEETEVLEFSLNAQNSSGCQKIKAIIYTEELYKEEEEEYLIESTLELMFIQKDKKIYVDSLSLIAG